jgi:heat shock protein HslJ
MRGGIAAGALRLLSAGTAALLMTACASVSLDEPFEGTPWRLVQLEGQTVYVAGSDPKVEPRVQFSASDSRVTGSGGCNSLSGSYRRSSTALRIGPIASTRMACADPGRSDVEARFVAALQATNSFNLKGAQLTLLDSRALPLAVLELGLREQP